MTTMRACCFTGHRRLPEPEPVLRQKLEAALLRLAAAHYEDFYCGGALGFDLLAGEAVLDTAARYALPLRLHMVLPCSREAQTRAWPAPQRQRQQRLLDRAATVVTLSPYYYPGCMQARNRYLVDHSSYCLCCLTQASGGTAYTVQYAQKKGLPVENLAAPQ